ncbi:MAG TPA: purine-nucleoside phosphorylase [Saprospiraceae bacterium]|nr:purine-nucleoside phosphorylase [Saprospiraceae bacterium]
MATPHLEAERGDIAETILLPGDPLRARQIAFDLLTDVQPFNQVRNMLGFTGNYQGKRVSVMGTGMGMPSMGIYSSELIRFYGVRQLIRIGTAGALQEHLCIRDVVLAQAASTDSNFPAQFGLAGHISATPDFSLLRQASLLAEKMGIKYHAGTVVSSDVFYHLDPDQWKKWQKTGALCVEMEAYALYQNARLGNVKALAMNVISDSLVTGEQLSAAERQDSFRDLARIALELIDYEGSNS